MNVGVNDDENADANAKVELDAMRWNMQCFLTKGEEGARTILC